MRRSRTVLLTGNIVAGGGPLTVSPRPFRRHHERRLKRLLPNAMQAKNLRCGDFPSFEEGAARRSTKCTVPYSRRGGGGQSRPQRKAVSDLPVCAAKERDHFFNGAATPPRRRGNDHASSWSLHSVGQHALKPATTTAKANLVAGFSPRPCSV